MRHGARTQSFNRPYNHRKWLMRNLAVSLVENERIKTTLQKAKELRRVVEKAVTLGKRGSLADRRLLLSRIPNENTVQKIFSTLAPRYSSRAGGYTRIYRLVRRAGDNAEMAIIEFIDAQLKVPLDKKSLKAEKKSAKAAKQVAPKKEAKPKKEKAEAKATKKAAKKSK
ncbi:MAG: 50S ribosomal protein L17 [Oligoflexia bacterium]|nr:50S ribosomal protein L17 [Oligoflexia bacterium]